MAKEGIDSFLLDCHTNENLSEIEAEFGVKGFAVIVRFWQKIYSEKGYYCEWTERSPLLFLAMWFGGGSGVDKNLIDEVVKTALRNGIFHAGMYEKYSILTSEGIQRRYFEVVKRRTEIDVVEEYLLVSVDNFKGNVCKRSISVDKNGKNVNRKTISKVKESKGKVREEKSIAAKPQGASATKMIQERKFPHLVEEAVLDWVKYKIERRQGYKENGLHGLLDKIAKETASHGEQAVADIIHDSIANNYQGIIWDRIGKKTSTNGGSDWIANRVSEVDSW